MSKYLIFWETDAEYDYDNITELFNIDNEEKALEEFRSRVLDTLLEDFDMFWKIGREFAVYEGNDENVIEKLKNEGYKVKRVIKSVFIANPKEEHRDFIYLALVEVE